METADIKAAMAKAIDLMEGKLFCLKCALHIIHNATKYGLIAKRVTGVAVEKLTGFINYVSRLNVDRAQFEEL